MNIEKKLNEQELQINGLSKSKNSISFKFTFTNTTGQKDYTAKLDTKPTLVNFDVAYTLDGASLDKTNFETNGIVVSYQTHATQPAELIITYTIPNTANNASITGDFIWTLG